MKKRPSISLVARAFSIDARYPGNHVVNPAHSITQSISATEIDFYFGPAILYIYNIMYLNHDPGQQEYVGHRVGYYLYAVILIVINCCIRLRRYRRFNLRTWLICGFFNGWQILEHYYFLYCYILSYYIIIYITPVVSVFVVKQRDRGDKTIFILTPLIYE